jgi:hypothetical protein
MISLQEPHDCFECFNRLTCRYSIYQYTQQERNIKREKQLGIGAVKRYESMVQREHDKENQKIFDEIMQRNDTICNDTEEAKEYE